MTLKIKQLRLKHAELVRDALEESQKVNPDTKVLTRIEAEKTKIFDEITQLASGPVDKKDSPVEKVVDKVVEKATEVKDEVTKAVKSRKKSAS